MTPSATESSFDSTYSSFDAGNSASAHGHVHRHGSISLHAGGVTGVVETDAAQHLAYIQEKDPFAAFNPTVPPIDLGTPLGGGGDNVSGGAGGPGGIGAGVPPSSYSSLGLGASTNRHTSLSRSSSARPSIGTAASMHHGLGGTLGLGSGTGSASLAGGSITNLGAPALRRRELLRPDHSIGIEEEQEWAEEEDTLDKIGEVQLPPMPSYLSSSRLALHPSESRFSHSSTTTSLLHKSRRWDPHARREVEKPDDAPADFSVVKPDGWSAKGMGLDATYKREKRREDRRQLVGKVFGFGRKKGKAEGDGREKERWEEEIEGRSVSVGSGEFLFSRPTEMTGPEEAWERRTSAVRSIKRG